ncbi:RNA methyltransferase [Advenella sp. RU8]|uniref:RNA methyltransferase n=1 Tax=Advenella sp. RU8 TaxID=3399575 RepID=UPI003AB00D3D
MLSSFAHTRFIMVAPSHPGNVGAAARAIKTMGFEELVLVSPKDPDIKNNPEAIALSSGATDVLQNAQIVSSLDEALAPVTLSFALTARTRDMGPPALDIRKSAELSARHLASTPANRVAVVLGTERTGLENEDISRCHRICHIPANPAYSSLNVSQALQLAAWELRYALMENHQEPVPANETENTVTYAPSEKVEAFVKHWEQALVAIDFLNPSHPKKLMPRMRYLFTRIHMSQEEVDMMRGVCTNIIRHASKK